MSHSLDLQEGAVFLVPLPTSGYGVGVLVRTNKKGQAFGFFFGPCVENAGQVVIENLKPANVMLMCRFGDYGLFNGRWPIIGHIKDWKINRWDLPKFVRPHDYENLKYLTEYNDRLQAVSEHVVDAQSVSHLPEDAQYGSSIVEKKLGELLLKPGKRCQSWAAPDKSDRLIK